MGIESLQKLVIDEFSGKDVQRFYRQKADEGLWQSERKLIDKYFKLKGKVLDVGCGTGRTTIALHRLGYQVIGIDITPAMIKTAKEVSAEKNLDIDYRIGDAASLEFTDDSFDNVLFSNQVTSLKEVKEQLRLAGFSVLYIGSGLNEHSGSWPTFFICKK